MSLSMLVICLIIIILCGAWSLWFAAESMENLGGWYLIHEPLKVLSRSWIYPAIILMFVIVGIIVWVCWKKLRILEISWSLSVKKRSLNISLETIFGAVLTVVLAIVLYGLVNPVLA